MRTTYASSRFVRPAGAFAAAGLLIALAACGGRTNSMLPATENPVAASSEDSFVVPDKNAKIKVTPANLAFAKLGKKFAKDAVVSEAGYKGAFKETTTCKNVATATPSSGEGPSFTVRVAPVKNGACTITFTDSKKNSAKLGIKVAAVVPTPTPSPTPHPTPTPTAHPTPTPTAHPTATPTASPTPHPTATPTASPTPHPTASPTPHPTATPGAITYTCNGAGAGDLSECGTESVPGQIDLYAPTGTGSTASFTSSQSGFTPGSPFGESDNCGSGHANIVNVTTSDGLTFTETAIPAATAGSCTIQLTGGAGATLSIKVTYTTNSIGINARHRHQP